MVKLQLLLKIDNAQKRVASIKSEISHISIDELILMMHFLTLFLAFLAKTTTTQVAALKNFKTHRIKLT